MSWIVKQVWQMHGATLKNVGNYLPVDTAQYFQDM
jgi:hypothetical protein